MRSNALASLPASSLRPPLPPLSPPPLLPPPPLALVGEGPENMRNLWPKDEFSLPPPAVVLLLALPAPSREPVTGFVDDPTPPLQTLIGSAAALLACPCEPVHKWRGDVLLQQCF